MKLPFLIAATAAVLVSGCAIFHRSPVWESVVASRSSFSGPADVDGKEGYINHLHRILSNAGVEHKVVTYHFHFFNAYREESVETATAIVYRDDTTPSNPWWVMDEFHHVPTWLPSWSLDRQLEFFTQRRVEVAEVKEYGAQPRRAAAHSFPSRRIAQAQHHRSIGLIPLPSKVPAKPRATAPIASEAPADARSRALFRNTHGSTFDPGSSVDRAKMGALRLKLLSRNQSVGLRPE